MSYPLALLLLVSSVWAAKEPDRSAKEAGPAPKILIAPFSGVISPVAAEFLSGAVDRAQKERFDALVIQLDTPGGLDTSMREIVKSVLNAKVPVVVYVYPTGSRAASAGVFITMAAHVAAMAPGTNIGAAHPVALPGLSGAKEKEKTDAVMEGKVANDAAAYLKSIALKRGRNAEWAVEAVAKSTSIPATEALSRNVIDLVASDYAELLNAIDGRKLADFDKPLRTAGAVIEREEMTRRQRWLAAISDPNVAMILMSLGAGGLFIELYNPGLILPGIVGAICLILAFYSFQTLSASYAGVLLILAGMVFFLLEIKVVSYDMLALGGIAATILGVLLLFQQQSMGGLAVSWSVIAGNIIGLVGVVALMSWFVFRAYQKKGVTGTEGMIGAEGECLDSTHVSVAGEIWVAEFLEGPLPKGTPVVVHAVERLKLKVKRK
ncbi:MAG: nodulation protein NfeD [Elusimicrobiota bacterium]